MKSNPGKVWDAGGGRIWDLARAGMLKTAGIPVDAMPWVPGTGAATALQDLVAGRLQVVTASLVEGRPLIDAGKVRALATMAEKRDPAFPDVPTLKELGINWSIGTWRGIALPKGTSPEIVAVYEKALEKIGAIGPIQIEVTFSRNRLLILEAFCLPSWRNTHQSLPVVPSEGMPILAHWDRRVRRVHGTRTLQGQSAMASMVGD